MSAVNFAKVGGVGMEGGVGGWMDGWTEQWDKLNDENRISFHSILWES